MYCNLFHNIDNKLYLNIFGHSLVAHFQDRIYWKFICSEKNSPLNTGLVDESDAIAGPELSSLGML